jgi:hypothetical protein
MRNSAGIGPAAVAGDVESVRREGMEILLRDQAVDAVVPVMMLTPVTGGDPPFIPELRTGSPEKPIPATFTGDEGRMDEC